MRSHTQGVRLIRLTCYCGPCAQRVCYSLKCARGMPIPASSFGSSFEVVLAAWRVRYCNPVRIYPYYLIVTKQRDFPVLAERRLGWSTQLPDLCLTVNACRMLYDVAKKIAKAPFRAIGLDLVRHRPPDGEAPTDEQELPPLFDDPLEALCYVQGGEPATFKCPLNCVVKQNALSYSPDGWHPFVATLRQREAGDGNGYDDSVLRQFYETHQPTHAAEAIVGFGQAPSSYANYPPHVYRLAPWSAKSPHQTDNIVRGWLTQDREEHTNGDLAWDLTNDGYPYQGPISRRAGELEYRRLVDICERIKAEGYDRSFGHANFLVLRRSDDYRFLNKGGGTHRAAAMAALGYETIPAVLGRSHVVDVEMARYWPNVQDGLWTREQAEAYFHHLFDFDSCAWARERGLLREMDSSLNDPQGEVAGPA